ncbi:ABEC1 enzyme, partial [Daphoenositta chrysoptera]|nr:ABEC1 enzyme [Daphoenositta chrysoptera]
LKFLFCFSMYIPRWTLNEQFDPRRYRPDGEYRQTYLLCKLRWGNNHRSWKHWVRNDSSCHAEEYFLKNIFEVKSSNFCKITWYLSWSPCARCCYEIRNFLQRNRKVNIRIRVARLYYQDNEETHRGLRHLNSWKGVNNLASVSPDYIYCQKTFLRRGVVNDFFPKDFRLAIQENRTRLNYILEVSIL